MSIDEIVASERDNAEFSKANGYDKSADYHEQIVEWLEELKAIKSNGRYVQGNKAGQKIGYNNGIDDFADRLKQENKETLPTHSGFCKMSFDEVVDEIAEQLKAGDWND